jgi:hypothetical protein
LPQHSTLPSNVAVVHNHQTLPTTKTFGGGSIVEVGGNKHDIALQSTTKAFVVPRLAQNQKGSWRRHKGTPRGKSN